METEENKIEPTTTNQDNPNRVVANPEGKGGFGDHPEHRSDGRWKKEDSQSYCLRFFLAMTEEEFLAWTASNPPEKRTVAQTIAHTRVLNARKRLSDYREVVDRTEGKAKQPIDLGVDDTPVMELLEKIYNGDK